MTAYCDFLAPGQHMVTGDTLTGIDSGAQLGLGRDALVLTQDAAGGTSTETLWSRPLPPGARLVFTSGGDLQVQTADGQLHWQAGTSGADQRLWLGGDGSLELADTRGGVRLHPGARARPTSGRSPVASLGNCTALDCGDVLWSANGRYRLVMQFDGNLVLYGALDATAANLRTALWSAGTMGTGACCAVFQGDGNLVVYTAGGQATGRAVWAAHTSDSHADQLALQNDGNLVIYRGNTAQWSTGTRQAANTGHGACLDAGQSLAVGDTLIATDQSHVLLLRWDGELLLQRLTGNRRTAVWGAGLAGQPSDHLSMQDDGNLVVYDAAGRPLWAAGSNAAAGSDLWLEDCGDLGVWNGATCHWHTNTAAPRAFSGQLPAGATLAIGDLLSAPQGAYRLSLTADGDLLWSAVCDGTRLWHSNSAGRQGHGAVMQHDGNLVLYTPGGEARGQSLWDTGTSTAGDGAWLAAQDDGNLVLYRADGAAAWATHTGPPTPA